MPDYSHFMIRLAIFCCLHSLLAAPRIKTCILTHIPVLLPWYRLSYNLISLVLFGWVMLAWQSTKVLFVAPGLWSLLMHGLQIATLAAGFICLKQTGLGAFLGTDRSQKNNDLPFITTGCYRVVRHPLYLLGILFMLLNPVITTRWLTLTLLIIPYLLFGALLEERRMVNQWGDRYRRYQEQVPFLLPCLPRR